MWLVWPVWPVIRPKLRRMRRPEPTAVDHEVADGDVLPIAGGPRVVHTRGHCAGHVAVLWPAHGGVLIGGDVAGHGMGLNVRVANEDLDGAERSLRAVGRHDFEVAVFGHGRSIAAGRSRPTRQGDFGGGGLRRHELQPALGEGVYCGGKMCL